MGWLAQPSGGNLLLEDGTKIKKETGKKAVSHDDAISVELAKEDSEDD